MIERKQAREERKGRKRQTDGEKEINRKIDVQTNKQKTVFSPSLWTIRAMFDSFFPPKIIQKQHFYSRLFILYLAEMQPRRKF